MKRFLLRLGTFLSLVLVGYVALFAVVMVLNRRAVGNCRLDSTVDSVILGDSHTAWAIDDADIAGLRNVSLNAEGYKYTYAKLRHLLQTERGIRRVYLSFSYHNLSGYYDEYIVGPTFGSFVDRYLSILTLGDYAELAMNNPRGAPDLFRRILRNGLPAGIRGDCRIYGRFSDEPMTKEFDFPTMEKRIREQYYVDGRLQSESSLNLEYLGKIIELSRDRAVELVVLNTPMHPEYEKRVPREYRERYNRYVTDHGLRVIDFRDLRLTDADFLPDGDHTNYRGAVLATRWFAEHHRTTWAASLE